MSRAIVLSWLAVLTAVVVMAAAGRADDQPGAKPAEAKEEKKTAEAKGDSPAASVAEQITRLQRTVEADAKQLAELNAELNNPESEFNKAQAEFKAIDEKYLAEKAEIAKKKEAGEDVGMKRLEDALAEIEKARKLARERADLAIQNRKTSKEQVTAIEEKLAQNKAALEKLVGPASPMAAPAQAQAAAPQASPATAPEKAQSAAAAPDQPMAPAAVPAPMTPAPAAATPAAPAPVAAPTTTPAPAAGAVPGTQASFMGGTSAGDEARERSNQEVAKAEQAAQEKRLAAETAMKAAASLSDRLKSLDKDIAIEQELLTQARKKAEIAIATREAHERDYHRVADEGGLEEIQAARAKRDESSEAVIKSQAEVTARMERLQVLQVDRSSLQREEFAAVSAAKERQVEMLRAQEKVVSLKNPFALHNILQWLLDHGPRLTLIVAVMFILRMLIKVAMKRVVDVMMQRGFRGTYEESEDRAKTLVGVFQNAASTTVIVGGMLMICEEVGVAVAPLLGGAAVVGLAVAFGAQNLIRDYFYGFVILLENQYKINDVLKIGDVSGQVERITLRMTVLRDLEGSVHFIPNGKIDCVTNMTHGWSRALFEIKVSFNEDTDHVVDMLLDIAKGLRAEPQYGRVILEDPEMLGVDALGDTWATIKFVIKTRPLKQWLVKREMLRRIRKKFSENGIGMPIQQRVIHHRGEQLAQNLPSSVIDAEAPKAA
jgi:small conductance mechanosensitive channel